jgi:hypothetical protein
MVRSSASSTSPTQIVAAAARAMRRRFASANARFPPVETPHEMQTVDRYD